MIPVRVTHRVGGRRARRDDRWAGYITGAFDRPTARIIKTGGEPIVRITGWVVSGRGRPTHVSTQIASGEWIEHPIDRVRSDVATDLAGNYPVPTGPCGFDIPLELPKVERKVRLPLVVEIGDDEFVGRTEFLVHHAPTPARSRADYKNVWNAVSEDVDSATTSVAGYTDEEELQRTADVIVSTLERTVGLHPDDVVLEIGAGVGRVGPTIAKRTKHWIATDVSENMLRHARKRCAGLSNVEFVPISGWDLAPIASESVDLVYCTVVFMHLDEWDRYNYVREAMRVLRPGGRLYADNINLLSDPGWELFMSLADGLHPLERPPNISKTSTPEELHTYFERAGFEAVRVESEPNNLWLIAYGRKPA